MLLVASLFYLLYYSSSSMVSFSPLFLVLLFLLCCCSWSNVRCLNQEGTALLSFKAAVSDPDGYLRNWNTWDESPCSWNGVTCSGLRVVSLRLPKVRLVGSIPPSLGTLSSLRHINLRNNELRGSLPVGLFDAQSLQSLVLYGNNLSGSVPSQIGKLKNLQVLDLSQNSFNGSLLVSLLQCRRLKILRLSDNGFAGALPDGFGASLSMLELLDLSHNLFDGHIPNDLGLLSHLQGTVDLSHNIFSGFIPTNLGDLPEKVYIDLSNNNLTGPIPQNGALVNRGPTAFLGNPGLCGPPLKNPCPSEYPYTEPSSLPHLPNSYLPPLSDISNRADGTKRKALSRVGLIAIVVGDVVGIILLGFAFFYCFGRVVSCKGKGEDDSGRKRLILGKECFCLRRDESDTPSENMEQLDLVPLDPQLNFDMDELLKASAFVLGKSGIGIVYKVVLEGGLTFAVRRLGEGGLQRFREFQTEVEAIGKLRHDNIVVLRAYYWSVEEKLLIYDYIPNGNLVTALHGTMGPASLSPMSWQVRMDIIKGIARGLVYLHEFSPKKYVHGDLKPTNILLGTNMEPHIADFGLGKLANTTRGSPVVQWNQVRVEEQQYYQPSEVSFITRLSSGTYYQAPEVMKLLKPSQKWDIYSFGVIVLEMITGRSPIELLSSFEMDIVRWTRQNVDESKPLSEVLDPILAQEPGCEEEIGAVLRTALACAHANPERRPSMRSVLDAVEKIANAG